MTNGLKKIIDFATQNKETCIVVDQNGDPQYVVVDFERYQQLVWKKPAPVVEQKPPVIEPIPSQKPIENSLNQEKKDDIPTEPEDAYYFEPID
jgi:hypothetical protein